MFYAVLPILKTGIPSGILYRKFSVFLKVYVAIYMFLLWIWKYTVVKCKNEITHESWTAFIKTLLLQHVTLSFCPCFWPLPYR